MGVACAIPDCPNSRKSALQKLGKKLRFYRFPKDVHRQNAWKKSCNFKKSFDPTHHRVCSEHFMPDDYEDMLQAQFENRMPRRLKKIAIPKPIPNFTFDHKDKNIKTQKNTKTGTRRLRSWQNEKTPSPAVSPKQQLLLKCAEKDLAADITATPIQQLSEETLEKCEIVYLSEQKTSASKNPVPIKNLSSTPSVNISKIENGDKASLDILLNKYNKLLKEHEHLKTENANLQNVVKQYENYMDSKIEALLSDFLTPSQMKILLQRN